MSCDVLGWGRARTVDLVNDDIGIGGGTAIDEELELIDRYGSATGAGSNDLHLEQGMVG